MIGRSHQRASSAYTAWRAHLDATGDITARFEAGADSSVGSGRAQHPIERQGSWGPASDCQPLYADQGLEGLQDKPRPGKQPIYPKATDKRILELPDKPPPDGFARWTGSLLAGALGNVDVQYVWRFLRSHKIDLTGRKSWCESNLPLVQLKEQRRELVAALQLPAGPISGWQLLQIATVQQAISALEEVISDLDAETETPGTDKSEAKVVCLRNFV